MSLKRHPKLGQRGFTIIELMIATAVLSTILVLVTVIMISIGNLYYKGVNQARVQDNVRAIAEDVGGNLKLNDVVPLPGPGATVDGSVQVNSFCVGTVRYTYVIGVQMGHTAPSLLGATTVFRHILWRDTINSATSCYPVDLSSSSPNNATQPGTGGTELAAPNARLINLSITTASPYAVSVGEAYGDDDLLCSSSVAGSCASPARMPVFTDFTLGNLQCKGSVGDQFCSTASLSDTVVQRLTDNSL